MNTFKAIQKIKGTTDMLSKIPIQTWPDLSMYEWNKFSHIDGGFYDIFSKTVITANYWRSIENKRETNYIIQNIENFDETILEENRELLNEILELLKNDKIDAKSLGHKLTKLVNLVIMVMTFHMYYDFITNTNHDEIKQGQIDTLKDVGTVITNQNSAIYYIKEIYNALLGAKESRITNRACYVKHKPKVKSLTLVKLPTNYQVFVLEIHHKWVYVNYFNPNDNLNETGWILKKYLSKYDIKQK